MRILRAATRAVLRKSTQTVTSIYDNAVYFPYGTAHTTMQVFKMFILMFITRN